jgi:thioredoxin-related protein
MRRTSFILLAVGLMLSACATARMHSQDELNSASLACGLTYGELIQDEEEKKLLIMFRQAPSPEQRGCVYQWARKRHLKLVVIDAIAFPEEQ